MGSCPLNCGAETLRYSSSALVLKGKQTIPFNEYCSDNGLYICVFYAGQMVSELLSENRSVIQSNLNQISNRNSDEELSTALWC